MSIISRRRILGGAGAVLAGTVAGSTLASGQSANAPAPSRGATAPAARRLVPREELVNTLEFEEQAKNTLPPATYALIAGGDRALLERVTLRPRMLVSTTDLNLSQTILGESHFVPILVGPVADQKRFHPDGEVATARGAAAAKTMMIVSSHSSMPLDQIAAQTKSFWYQVFASEAATAKAQIDNAVKAGAKAVVITVGAAPATTGVKPAVSSPINWAAFDSLKQGVAVPVLVKGVATAAEAAAALQHNAQGIIVSNYGSKDALILELPKIIDAVAGKAPVLIDGSFRRGSDVLKALALGAQAVIVARPVMWGLAAYGADGVQAVVEMLQTDLGRFMGMCGKSNLAMLDRTVVKIHGLFPAKTSMTPAL